MHRIVKHATKAKKKEKNKRQECKQKSKIKAQPPIGMGIEN